MRQVVVGLLCAVAILQGVTSAEILAIYEPKFSGGKGVGAEKLGGTSIVSEMPQGVERTSYLVEVEKDTSFAVAAMAVGSTRAEVAVYEYVREAPDYKGKKVASDSAREGSEKGIALVMVTAKEKKRMYVVSVIGQSYKIK